MGALGPYGQPVTPAAVIVAAAGAPSGPTVEAVERQTRAPGRILVAESGPRLTQAIEAASECDPVWVWLLDGGVIPEPDALERLLDAAQRNFPAPALVVSKVVRPDGTLDPGSLPVPEVHRSVRVLAALDHHAVPLRVARRGSMLVRRGALVPKSAGRALDRDLEWTARLLASEPGILEPASVVVRAEPRRRSAGPGLANSLRLLAALEPRERLWFAVHFGEQALAAWRTNSERRGVA